MTLGERVRLIRIELLGGITQTEFAEKLGVTRDEIGNIELNRLKKPESKMPLLLLICSTFGVRKEWLLDGEGPMKLPEADEDLEYINRLLADDDSSTVAFIRKFLKHYNSLPPDDQRIIDNLVRSLVDSHDK